MPGRLDALALDGDTRARLDFLVAAHGLTAVTRLNRLLDGSRAETSAEHSWHLALTALVLAPAHGGAELDLARVLALVIVHDVVEVDAGDVPVYGVAARDAAAAAEARAAERLFGLLPADEGAELRALWHEFEAARTPEARFARAVDRLQPILVHWAGDGATWREHTITEAQERAMVERVAAFWPPLRVVAEALVDDAVARGLLAERGPG